LESPKKYLETELVVGSEKGKQGGTASMGKPKVDIKKRMEALRESFKRQIPEKVSLIESQWASFLEDYDDEERL